MARCLTALSSALLRQQHKRCCHICRTVQIRETGESLHMRGRKRRRQGGRSAHDYGRVNESETGKKKEEDEECHLCCSPRHASPTCHFRLLSATLGLTNNDMPAQHCSWLVFVSHHHHCTETHFLCLIDMHVSTQRTQISSATHSLKLLFHILFTSGSHLMWRAVFSSPAGCFDFVELKTPLRSNLSLCLSA